MFFQERYKRFLAHRLREVITLYVIAADSLQDLILFPGLDTFSDDAEYMRQTGELLREFGVDVPLYTANGCSLESFRSELKAAGIDEIIAAMQEQYDAFLASK